MSMSGKHDDYNSIMTKALGDRFAEALRSACIRGRGISGALA